MERLSEARKKYPKFFDFLFRSPLYQRYRISTEIVTKCEREILGYTIRNFGDGEEMVPDIVDFTVYIENLDLSILKGMVLKTFDSDYFCPFCDKEREIRNIVQIDNSEKYIDRELDRIDNFSLQEYEEFIDNLKNEESKERYQKFVNDIFSEQGIFSLKLECVSKYKHHFIINLKIEEDTVMKIGQYPSIYMFNKSLDKYRKVIKDKRNKIDFKRAIELQSFGYFVGAFTHLRRIFERIVSKKFDELLNEKLYEYKGKESISKLSTVDKAKEISSFLPSHLNDVRSSLYSILSEGIHKLDEEKCEKYYYHLFEAITIIFDEELEMRKKQWKANQNKKEINKVNSELKSAGENK
ncbi:hypothetical protein [Bacillus sp. KS1]|uniref:hypothetical protein n=1 Tax=Bacillus sp. KS1 TaxID=2748045 RepID=UPI001CCD0B60|nr:hypothetical protein [Bacillus sp. KS1]MBZ5517418.1 hypothetical protein [Bacillus sp. KS1]